MGVQTLRPLAVRTHRATGARAQRVPSQTCGTGDAGEVFNTFSTRLSTIRAHIHLHNVKASRPVYLWLYN